MGWYRCTSHSKNHSTECEKPLIQVINICVSEHVISDWHFTSYSPLQLLCDQIVWSCCAIRLCDKVVIRLWSGCDQFVRSGCVIRLWSDCVIRLCDKVVIRLWSGCDQVVIMLCDQVVRLGCDQVVWSGCVIRLWSVCVIIYVMGGWNIQSK